MLREFVIAVIAQMMRRGIPPEDVVTGVLFGLDVGFRSGVVNMVRGAVEIRDVGVVLIPAIQVAAPGLRNRVN